MPDFGLISGPLLAAGLSAAAGGVGSAIGGGVGDAIGGLGGLASGAIGAAAAEDARKKRAEEIMNAAGGPVKSIAETHPGAGNPAATMGLTSSPFAGSMNPIKAPTAPAPTAAQTATARKLSMGPAKLGGK